MRQSSSACQYLKTDCESLTWDRGKELAAHKRFSLATDIGVFFCDPQQPWQRGSNETVL